MGWVKANPCPTVSLVIDQRVTHAVVTENKRISMDLAHVKELQEKAPPKPKVRTNSEKMGSRLRPREKAVSAVPVVYDRLKFKVKPMVDGLHT